MKTSPSLATKALSMHNAILRKAAHDNAGHVIDQEGDSWSVAFYEPQDAVAFCLQAQQALQRVRPAALAWLSQTDCNCGVVARRPSPACPFEGASCHACVARARCPPSNLARLTGRQA